MRKSFPQNTGWVILLLCVLLAFLAAYTKPVTDGDLFWHLQSGRWIVDHGALPTVDPFSFTQSGTLSPADAFRQQFILHQYWLGQIALYGVWSLAGIPGIILLRAGIYVTILVLLYLWMTRQQKGFAPAVLVFLVANLLCEYPNERPQLFSFLFFPLLLFLLEKLRAAPLSKAKWLIPLLPLLVLLWANTHAAFLLGVGILLIYGVGSLFRRGDGKMKYYFSLFLLGTVLVSWLNPTGWDGLQVARDGMTSEYQKTIMENLSPLTAAWGLHEYFPWYWCYVGIVLITLVVKRRSIDPIHGAVLLALLALSLTALRHMIYLLLAAPLLSPYLGNWRMPRPALRAVVVAALLFWAGTRDYADAFSLTQHKDFPVAAIQYLAEHPPVGPVFNCYEWGGVMGWKLKTVKNFIDGRGLSERVSSDYEAIMQAAPGWRERLEKYGVQVLLIPGVQVRGGRVYPLVQQLYFDSSWQLVFQDDVALVFVKNEDKQSLPGLDKRRIYEHVLARAEWILKAHPEREVNFLLTIGDTAAFLGERQRAQDAYAKVLEIEPGNPRALKMIGRQ